ncbi:MAG: hypothetical protein JNK04_22935 [Myxococcales bacterium]|nr:hypothetical protein [Myxococcales bacterium]
MSEDQTQWWTADHLARLVPDAGHELLEQLQPLVEAGLLVERGRAPEALYRFAPVREADAQMLARLRALSAQGSPALVRAVSTHAIERIRADARRTFSDALPSDARKKD